jgi:hypothetical protein
MVRAHHLGEALPLSDGGTILGDRPRHVLGIRRLPRAAAIRIGLEARAEGAERDDRVAFPVGADDAGEHVARAAGRIADHHTRLTRDARVALRNVHGRLLVVRVDVADTVRRGVRDDWNVRAIDDAAQHLNALGLQTADEQLAYRDLGHREVSPDDC